MNAQKDLFKNGKLFKAFIIWILIDDNDYEYTNT